VFAFDKTCGFHERTKDKFLNSGIKSVDEATLINASFFRVVAILNECVPEAHLLFQAYFLPRVPELYEVQYLYQHQLL